MTYLELVQSLSDESGVGGGGTISTVAGLTGRQAKYARWINAAWRDIQNMHRQWRWMEAEVSGPTVAAQSVYTAAQLGISSRFAEWVYGYNAEHAPWTIFLTADGAADEGFLRFMEWPSFRARYQTGIQQTGKPAIYTVTPRNEIALSSTPDAVYTVRGLYRRAPQTLSADGDTPEMPDRFHSLIVDVALTDYLAVDDEALSQLPLWLARRTMKLSDLRIDQLPRIYAPGAMA